jgi:polyisoprenoid-binding protein YceI
VPGTQDPATADLEQLVKTGKVFVPVADLECGNGKMNDHMRKALKAADNPAIEFTLVSYELRGTQALLRGTLGIAGAQQEIEIPATVTQEDGGVVRVKGETEIRMTKWGVKPPSLMLGTMKVKDPVTIGFDVTVER